MTRDEIISLAREAGIDRIHEYEYVGFIEKHRFAKEEWCRKAALELRSLYAENAALRSGCDASRHEIEALRTRVQELGQMARDCNSRRVLELQAKVQELESMLAAVGAGGVEPLRKANHFRDATKMICAKEAPARKPLADRQIQDIWCSARSEGNQIGPFWFAHAIERAHGIT